MSSLSPANRAALTAVVEACPDGGLAQLGGAVAALPGDKAAELAVIVGQEARDRARRATAFALNAMGMREEAVALLQQDPNVAKAFQVAADQRKARAAQPAAGPVPPVMVDGVPFPGAVRLPDGRWVRM